MSLCLCIGLLAPSSPALAQSPTAPFSGDIFLRYCHEDVPARRDRQFELVQCYAFMNGVAFTFSTLVVLFPRLDGRLYCPPDSADLGEQIRVLRRYLEIHPEETPLPTSILFFKAMQQAYPCPT